MNQPNSEKERLKPKAHCQPLDPTSPSTCSPHGCPPGSVESNPADTPGCDGLSSHRASLQPPQPQDTMATREQPRAPRDAHPRGSPHDNSSTEGRPAGRPPPSASTGCSLGLNRESCELLGTTPGDATSSARTSTDKDSRGIPNPERRADQEHFLSLTILLPLPS